MFFMGTDAQMLAWYVRSGEAILRWDDPHRPHPPATRSELESVRRALRNLRKQGLIEVTKYRHGVYKMPGKKPKSG